MGSLLSHYLVDDCRAKKIPNYYLDSINRKNTFDLKHVLYFVGLQFPTNYTGKKLLII